MVECKRELASEFEMKDFGLMLCREPAGSDLANPSEYRQLVGASMFLVNTCPYICYVVNTLSQFMTEPLHAHWFAAKYVMRYLHGTITLGLRYTARDVRLHGYTYADWARIFVDKKSTSGYCFSLGSAMISLMSRNRKSIALRIAKAGYITASMLAVKQFG